MVRYCDNDQGDVDLEASTWLVRMEEAPSTETRRQFTAWLAADPRHGKAYGEMRQTWVDVAELQALGDLAPFAASSYVSGRGWRRRSVVACVTAIAASLVAIVAVPHYLGASPDQLYATGLGETRVVALPDGSHVTLGAKSAIAVRFTQAERRVVLSAGEAFFDVADADRPFLVQAGSSIVRDIGTTFDLNLTDRTLRVAVSSGLVQVISPHQAPTIRTHFVRAGERAEVPVADSSGAGGVSAAPPRNTASPSAGAWREGRLVYDDVRLSDLAADINRYYKPGVRLSAADVGELRVTASFKVREIPVFMGALGGTLPVTAEPNERGTFVVRPQNRTADMAQRIF